MAAYLFTVEDRTVRPTTEALLVSPFKEIWERDTHPNKTVAIQEFSYIEFMTSLKATNPYKGYAEEVRKIKLVQMIFQGDDWEPDELVTQGMKLVSDFQTEASDGYNFFMSAKNAVRKLEDFFNGFDMNDVSERSGMPLYKPKDITNALKDTEDVIQKLDKLAKKVEEELFDKVVTKANKEVSPFADPDRV